MNGLDFDSDLFLRLLLAAPVSWESDLKVPENVLAEYDRVAEELELEDAAIS
jgi:hypothetical protein